jgi:hypothetical protein
MVKYSVVWFGEWCGGMVWYCTVRCGMVQYGVEQYGMVWYGMVVWCSMVGCGEMVKCSVVWYLVWRCGK